MLLQSWSFSTKKLTPPVGGVNFGQGPFSSLEVKNLRLSSRKKAQNIQGEDRRSIFHRNMKCLVRIVDYFHECLGRDDSNRFWMAFRTAVFRTCLVVY